MLLISIKITGQYDAIFTGVLTECDISVLTGRDCEEKGPVRFYERYTTPARFFCFDSVTWQEVVTGI